MRLLDNRQIRTLHAMRPYIAFLGLILTIAGCATHKKPSTAVSDTPVVTISFHRIIATNDNTYIALFDMKNTGDSDLWFSGYGCEDPISIVQHKSFFGGWAGPSEAFGWCGNGLIRCRLAAGKSRPFCCDFPLQRNRTFRLGIEFSLREIPSDSSPTFTYWSEDIHPDVNATVP